MKDFALFLYNIIKIKYSSYHFIYTSQNVLFILLRLRILKNKVLV